MKNFAKFLGIIAFVAVIGFSMAACDDGSKDDNGGSGGGVDTWSAVTSLTQLNGTWKGTQTETDTELFADENITITTVTEVTMTITATNANTGTMSGSGKATMTFSGTGLDNETWELISRSLGRP